MKTREEIVSALKKEIERFSRELDDLQKFHRAAWEEYGSELSSGEMLEKERALAKEIAKICMFLAAWESKIEGQCFINSVTQLRTGLEYHRAKLREHQQQIETQESMLETWRAMAHIAGVDVDSDTAP